VLYELFRSTLKFRLRKLMRCQANYPARNMNISCQGCCNFNILLEGIRFFAWDANSGKEIEDDAM
jgi:hypothetical protein